MKQLVVYGAGGMGTEVAETIQACIDAGRNWELLGFVDDDAQARGTEVLGLPVLGGGEWLAAYDGVEVVLGIGHPRIRHKVIQKVNELGAEWASVIHPSAKVAPSCSLGRGVMGFADCIFSSRTRIGDFTYFHYRAVISHDTTVSDYACVMTNVALSGNVRVGTGTFVGAGTTTRQGISIGDWTIIGAGAAVVGDIPSYCVAAGVPARPLRHYENAEQMPGF